MINFNFSRKSRDWNEDRCYSCEKFAFVIDGATSLFKQQFSNYGSDAEWYAEWWFIYLKDALSNEALTLPDILQNGIDLVVDDFKKLAKGEDIKDFPSATISIVRRINERLEMYVLGDSPIILQAKSNTSVLIAETLNNVNDDLNKLIVKDLALKNNISVSEARKQFPNCLEERRFMKNRFGGHYILADDRDAILHGVYRFIDENLIKKVLIMSDGYSQIFDIFEKYSLNELADRINSEKDAEEVYQQLCKLQEQDPDCNEFIRFKLRDDATLAVFVLD